MKSLGKILYIILSSDYLISLILFSLICADSLCFNIICIKSKKFGFTLKQKHES